MALDAQQVDALQNSSPTNWNALDAQLVARSDGDANRFAMDHKLHVRFFMKPRLNADKSAAANRPIYEDAVYVEIMMPGEKNNIVMRPAWEQDFQRFAKHYEQFKAGVTEQLVGTPIKLAPFLSEAQVEELAWFKIKTIEQLAELNDGINFMGANDLRQKARRYLEGQTSNQALIEKINELTAQVSALKGKK